MGAPGVLLAEPRSDALPDYWRSRRKRRRRIEEGEEEEVLIRAQTELWAPWAEPLAALLWTPWSRGLSAAQPPPALRCSDALCKRRQSIIVTHSRPARTLWLWTVSILLLHVGSIGSDRGCWSWDARSSSGLFTQRRDYDFLGHEYGDQLPEGAPAERDQVLHIPGKLFQTSKHQLFLYFYFLSKSHLLRNDASRAVSPVCAAQSGCFWMLCCVDVGSIHHLIHPVTGICWSLSTSHTLVRLQ